jgi:glycosyltransferase involved in cell wall biosynthesis
VIGRRSVVLFVHGPRNVGGDSVVLLRTLEQLDRTQVDPVVVATPNCEAWQRFVPLHATGRIRLIGLDMGVTGTDAASPRHPRPADALVVGAAFIRLLLILMRERADVVYTLDRSRAVLLASAAARLLRRGLVFHAHYPYYPSARWSVAVVRAANCVVAISDFIRREYEQRGIDPRRIRVVYNGIDADEYAPRGNPDAVRAKLGLADGQQLVLLPGRLSRYKGQLELLEALPAILENVPGARCVFAGYDSPELGDLVVPGCGTVAAVLERRAAELGVSDRVQLTGATDRLAELYTAADVVVVPSWAEPFGLVVAEAMAAGRPIVASAGGAIPELIENETTGLLVPPRDPAGLAVAIVRMLQEPELRARLGEAAQRVVREKFTIARYSSEIQAVLLGVAARRA